MWDPERYPDVETIEDLGKALPAQKGVVRYFGGAAYMEHPDRLRHPPGRPRRRHLRRHAREFVTDQGKSAQQGFATAEPFIYENQVQAWGKAVKYQLIYDLDSPTRPIAARTGDMRKLEPCLKKLVPIMQQADVDFLDDPAATNELIVKLVDEYNNGWTYDTKVGDYAVQQDGKGFGIAANGPNGYIGEMEADRIGKLIEQAKPIFAKTKGAGGQGRPEAGGPLHERVPQQGHPGWAE